MTVGELAEELGLDVVGVTRAEPYVETERHIRERRARGLFADMKFTMAQPEVSCHPETLLPGARTVVSAALCYYAPEDELPAVVRQELPESRVAVDRCAAVAVDDGGIARRDARWDLKSMRIGGDRAWPRSSSGPERGRQDGVGR